MLKKVFSSSNLQQLKMNSKAISAYPQYAELACVEPVPPFIDINATLLQSYVNPPEPTIL